mmetsp:Transcript_30474/g.78017  ORF Transcript_30474/g.78017 Transcript_30474/m.78017 type:complete len:410 (+) Transcript_30474:128-1357(+)
MFLVKPTAFSFGYSSETRDFDFRKTDLLVSVSSPDNTNWRAESGHGKSEADCAVSEADGCCSEEPGAAFRLADLCGAWTSGQGGVVQVMQHSELTESDDGIYIARLSEPSGRIYSYPLACENASTRPVLHWGTWRLQEVVWDSGRIAKLVWHGATGFLTWARPGLAARAPRFCADVAPAQGAIGPTSAQGKAGRGTALAWLEHGEAQKSKCDRIFRLCDVDNDGFLDFAALSRLFAATSNGQLAQVEFHHICDDFGCDANQGLDAAALLRAYIEIGGDLDEDLQALEKRAKVNKHSGWDQPSSGPPCFERDRGAAAVGLTHRLAVVPSTASPSSDGIETCSCSTSSPSEAGAKPRRCRWAVAYELEQLPEVPKLDVVWHLGARAAEAGSPPCIGTGSATRQGPPAYIEV